MISAQNMGHVRELGSNAQFCVPFFDVRLGLLNQNSFMTMLLPIVIHLSGGEHFTEKHLVDISKQISCVCVCVYVYERLVWFCVIDVTSFACQGHL